MHIHAQEKATASTSTERNGARDNSRIAIRDRLTGQGIEWDVLEAAESQGFVRYGTESKLEICGRRPSDAALMLRVGAGERQMSQDPNHLFAPILRGTHPHTIAIVHTGMEALARQSIEVRAGDLTSTVIVRTWEKEIDLKVGKDTRSIARFDLDEKIDLLKVNRELYEAQPEIAAAIGANEGAKNKAKIL